MGLHRTQDKTLLILKAFILILSLKFSIAPTGVSSEKPPLQASGFYITRYSIILYNFPKYLGAISRDSLLSIQVYSIETKFHSKTLGLFIIIC